MKKYYFILLLAFVLTLAAATESFGQFTKAHNEFSDFGESLLYDYAYFRADSPDTIRLEVYYQLYNFGLMFEKVGDTYEADYDLNIRLLDRRKNVVETHRKGRKLSYTDQVRTRSRNDYRTSQVEFLVPPGKYTLEFELVDHKSEKVVRRDKRIRIRELERIKPTISRIEFVQAVHVDDTSSTIFRKGDIVVVPSVTRSYAGGENSHLTYYLEVYPGRDKTPKVVVETRIRRTGHGMIYRDTLHLDMTDVRDRQLRQVNLSGFSPGEYEIELSLLARRGKTLIRKRYVFEVLWDIESVIDNDWQMAISQLKYIEEPGETKGWDELATAEDRRRAFAEFWLSRDPTLGTIENEVKDEFYRRVAIANRYFAALHREGWETDRGYVFIRFGHPDHVEDAPFSLNALPYQVWHYYHQGPYRQFTFVDENQDGDYRLQYPYDGLGMSPDFGEY